MDVWKTSYNWLGEATVLPNEAELHFSQHVQLIILDKIENEIWMAAVCRNSE